MAFEDDMIEAGYSDEQEYLDSLLDDFDENYKRQLERENSYDDNFDSYYDDEEERERLEIQLKTEKEKRCVKEWKDNNPDLAIIWQAVYRTKSYYADMSNMENRHFMGLNELNELKKWINDRQRFENERQKNDWQNHFKELFSLYKNELFKFYFPEDDEQINMALIPQQASELSAIEKYEPLLWESISSSYEVTPRLLDNIELAAFGEMVYDHEMDYDYWKDNNTEQYNQIAKQWIANGSLYYYGEWLNNHKADAIEWKNNNQVLREKYKNNYEIREKNKLIESLLEEQKSRRRKRNSVFEELDSFWDEDYLGYETKKPFLPDLESTEETPYDISSLDKELQDRISSLDMNMIYKESSNYADNVLTQLWLFSNRDEWEMEAVKKHCDHLVKFPHKNPQDFVKWWKEKYATQWNDFLNTIVPVFKRNFKM